MKNPEHFLCVGVFILALGLHSALGTSNLRTLRTFQVHACDGDDLRIECWPNTIISIYLALYGRQVTSLQICPPETDAHLLKNETCLASEALKTVESTCRDQRVCLIRTSPGLFGEDPCPGIRKYVEVAYKCRPNTFFNKVVCAGDKLKLRCHKSLRIIIYSATFGGTRSGVPECPQLRGTHLKECQASYATETVMTYCHGKRKCSLSADVDTFGDPSCSKETHAFLKVVYTCVPKETLKDLDLVAENDKGQDEQFPSYIESPYFNHMTSSPPEERELLIPDRKRELGDFIDVKSNFTTDKADIQSDENMNEGVEDANCTVVEKDHKVVGFITEWISAYKFISGNSEKFILYLTISLGTGLLVFLVVLAARLYCQKQRERHKMKLNISEPLSDAFENEDVSDTDQYDTRQDRNVEVVRYTNRSTIRRQDSDTHPRAPMSHSMNNYYYS